MPSAPMSNDATIIPLSPWELDNLHLPPITTLTFYPGTAPVGYLRSRVAELLAANPWLTARLVKKGTPNGDVALSVPPRADSESVVDSHFKVYDAGQTGLADDLDYRELVSRVLPVQCARSKPAIDHEPLFKVAVMPLEGEPRSSADAQPSAESASMHEVDPGGFALMVSMNHTVGDGHTYYRLYQMLSADADMQALEPTRVQGFEDEKTLVVGAKESAFLTSAGVGLGVVGTFLLAKATRRQQHVSVHALDQTWVDAQKELARAEGKVPFVSTNDVMTSWFFRDMDSDANLMVANFRSRTPSIAGLGEEHVGNYEANIPYFRGDVETPALIRQSIRGEDGTFRARPAGTPTTAIPGFFTMLRNRMSIITNWASFYHEFALAADDGHRRLISPELHIPIMESEGMITSVWNNAILFASGKGRLGILLITQEQPDAAPGTGPLGPSII